MKIEKSICGGFIRITVNGVSFVLTTSEWSRAIGKPGEFMVTPADKVEAQSRLGAR